MISRGVEGYGRGHPDYLWSGDEEACRQVFVEMIDRYLDHADATEAYPPEHQSRWSCDGSLWMWTCERNGTKRDFERLLSCIRDGHVSVRRIRRNPKSARRETAGLPSTCPSSRSRG